MQATEVMNFMNSKNITQEQFDSMTLPLDTKYGILTETSLSAAEELILRCFCFTDLLKSLLGGSNWSS